MFLIVNILNTDFHINFIKSNEDHIFKSDITKKFSNTTKISYFTENDLGKALNFISSNINVIERLLVVKDKRLDVDFELYKIGFVGEIDYKEAPLSKHYLAEQVTKILKNFRYMNGLFSSGDDIELLRLPFLNFNSDFLGILPNIIRDKSFKEEFQEEFNSCLSSIRKIHRKPKRRSGNKRKFFLDNANKYFDLGDERHAHHETGHPHDSYCNLKAHLRFGFKLDARQHFNVSYDSDNTALINGSYLNCHEEDISFRKRVHLNIFTNDFIT